MIHQIILPRLHILGRAKVHPVLLAHMLHLLVRPGQPGNARMELLEIIAQDVGGITGGIAGDEHGKEDILVLSRLVHFVDNRGHLIQFIRADIWTMREAKVDLSYHIISTISNLPG